MDVRDITDRKTYNRTVFHPLQSYEWGEFREQTGIQVIRKGIFEHDRLVDAFQMTLHKLPKLPKYIGYIPKGAIPSEKTVKELHTIGKNNKCVFIQLEPNNATPEGKKTMEHYVKEGLLVPSVHPLFTKYTFYLDLTQTEEMLLKNMHPKTRYNIKVAKKHNVIVQQETSAEAFAAYWKLTEETTKRQGFFAHTKKYHELQWQTFPHTPGNYLSSHLFTARYAGNILTAMLFFIFGNTLYYPYGASSNEHRNVMHSTLTMWEAIRFGREQHLKNFDMWGALSENPDEKDPWLGFHDFKRKFGPKHVSFVGSYDLVIDKTLYQGFKLADKLRWLYLRMRR